MRGILVKNSLKIPEVIFVSWSYLRDVTELSPYPVQNWVPNEA